MKVWYGIYKTTRSLMIEYYVKINGIHYSMTRFRKLDNRKRYKPERLFRLTTNQREFARVNLISEIQLEELPHFEIHNLTLRIQND